MKNFGSRILVAGGYNIKNGAGLHSGTGFPKSGTSGTTVLNGVGANPKALYIDESTGVVFVNEGTAASPYWTPVSFDQRGLMGWDGQFEKGMHLVEGTPNTVALGKPIASTTATATLIGSGIRIHGQGVAETDSGMTVAMSDQGPIATLLATDEDAHTIVMSVGSGTTPIYQPDQNGTMVIDATISQKDDILLRAAFVGFCGSAADALDPIVTGSGTTISFAATVGDDVAGLYFDVGLTDGDRWFAPHDKGNTNASIATTATGVDTGVDVAAAGTYQRLRVECDADGVVRVFIAKALISTFSACLDADEEIHPILYLENVDGGTPGVQEMLVRQFMTWGKRAY